jgi:O-antigen ligase
MFAIPGIAALVVFILVRPQEYLPLLQRVPFLHLFAVFAMVGWVIDVRLRRTQPMGTPGLPWAGAFLLWCVITVAIVVPEQMIPKLLELIVLFTVYGTIGHGIQRFRAFQIVAGVFATVCVLVAAVCLHQGMSPKQCVAGEEMTNESVGRPDGRECETMESCKGPDAEPGMQYRCEHVGIAGMHSVDGRVRYRGDLQDPNEVSLVIAAGGISLLAAFLRRKREASFRFFGVLAICICIATIMLTKSRGGQIAMLLVFFVYMVKAYGWKALIPAAMMALPLLLFGGRSDESADQSTMERYEAWAAGLDMFRNSPLYGVGAGQFVEHHYLTAHNSFVLTFAELGLPGLVLFVSMIYVSVKSLWVGLRVVDKIPGADVARVWGMALLGSLAGTIFSISTLSFAYKSVLWILFGLVGAWTNCIRHHKPDFTVQLSWKDFAIIVIACLLFVGLLLPLFLKAKGVM